MADEPKKTLYHKELRDKSPVLVKVKSNPQPSTKQKGKWYVELEMEGRTRYYNPENQGCQDFFQGRAGQTIHIAAEESREAARIIAVGQPGTQVQPPPQKPQNQSSGSTSSQPAPQQANAPAPKSEPAPQNKSKEQAAKDEAAAINFAKRLIARNAVLADLALHRAGKAYHRFEMEYGFPMPPELWVAYYGTCLYGLSKHGADQGLPLQYDIPLNPAITKNENQPPSR